MIEKIHKESTTDFLLSQIMSRNDLVNNRHNRHTSIILKECILTMLEYKIEIFGKHYLMVFN